MTTRVADAPRLPLLLRLEMLGRLLIVQSSWNYESMLGPGLGFALEPALRNLPGGRGGAAYREAIARQSGYFNSHPYMAAVAAGALARAELDGIPGEKIARFRTALCGPLGSLGDRLVWAGLLPVCSMLALAVFGLGAGPLAVVLTFLIPYNVGHIWIRVWGLEAGWRHGMGVSVALGGPLMKRGPAYISQAGALLTGLALPLAIHRLAGDGVVMTAGVLAAASLLAAALVVFRDRVQGWRVALAMLVLYATLAVVI